MQVWKLQGSTKMTSIYTISTRKPLPPWMTAQSDFFSSCFPIVPKLACKHLGLSSSKGAKPITLLGGLTSFGGAGNNYSMHVSLQH